MKKILSISLLIATMLLVFAACSKEDEKIENQKPSLVGTEWTAKYGDDSYIIIKFTSETRVEGYYAADGNLSSGSYSFDGYNVTFTDFIIDYFGTAQDKYETGRISGSTLEINFYTRYSPSSDWGPLLKNTFYKR